MESVRHSADLLKPPVGAGVAFLKREKESASPLKTFKVETSSLLGRVKCFIPVMQQAQEELRGKAPEELDIETVDDTEPHIQIDLALLPLPSSDSESSDEGVDEPTSDPEGQEQARLVTLKLPKARCAKKRNIEELEPKKN